MSVLLSIDNLNAHHGQLPAVRNVLLQVHQSDILALVGANGAGKTTLLRTLAGAHRASSGTVRWEGVDITRLPAHQRVAEGLALVPEGRRLFAGMTVRENLMMVPANQSGESLFNACFRRGAVAAEERRLRDKADEVLEFLTISHLADQRAANISGGQKKLLELGRTMMVDAKIVFLDEVGAGVNRTLLNTIGDAIVRLNKERGYTFCVIEHDMDFIGRLCDPVICMAEGTVLAQGTVDQVKNDERVIEAYLGTGLKNKVKEEAAHG